MKKKKKENHNCCSGPLIVAVIAIIAILLIVLLVSISFGKSCGTPRPDIIVSIDRNGNVYDGQDRYVGKLADPNFTFYDEQGNLLGQAVFNLIK
jgi:hypothetical protein